MRIYNTLTGKKEEFVPIDPDEIKIYVCGPTVYNYFHLGNARPFVVFDTLRRYLEYKGYKVKFVQNFTDVDDKIINKAREEGVSASDISEKYIREYYKDAEKLNVKKATVHPKVTENIKEIKDFISTLIDKGYAYDVNGDVYYSTRKFKGYGKLSGQNIEDLEAGARIQVGDLKRDPMDFALWKAKKSEDEIAWESPWGQGRPGWHIECSVMSNKYLGDTIDIHAGGQDLEFPHHENEIAQTEAYTGKKFANYWMHNGFITINKEKMAKSRGNFFMVRDILDEYDGEVVRYFLLSGHYRNPIDFSKELMEQAKNSLSRIRNTKINLEHFIENAKGSMNEEERKQLEKQAVYKEKFKESMEDDLNTADAISAIFELVKEINTVTSENSTKEFCEKELGLLTELSGVLGLLKENEKSDIPEEVSNLVEERQAARKAKDFARADEIRDELKRRGITLEDTPQGIRVIMEER